MHSLFSKSFAGKVTLLLFSVISFSLTGCLDNDVETPEPTPTTYFSLYHGSPDAPDFDIYIDNQLLNRQPFKYTSYTGYLPFKPDSYGIKFTSVNAADAFVDSTLTFEDGKAYSVFAINKLDDLELLAVQDVIPQLAAGKAGIRVVHLSPDAAPLDITTTGTAGNVLTSDLAFKEITSFMPVDASKYNLEIKSADTGETLVTVTNATFAAGANYTLIIRGFKTPPSGNANTLHAQLIRNL
ncbi:DUF4397 domain-containing protein [Pontibacter akesuensis]|uniref:DUF4397 domain-containing protein n=1 Tax=Pontibacter akesuensis TaxID=388950 RepID=A0A1I7KEG8_9BACT|nr:DUF4397 domain-containing protein [Pontibacter akesuensis]GHA79852.1 hypothetical protein GCM10007389_37630 [Pontibacter akesuensis]SFU95784.1 protein of unknown function [Pontibacter akesuensis]